jgi:NADH-quinone oxidoreductase subunit J
MSTSEQVLFWTVGSIVVLSASALLFAKRAVVTACSVMLTMVGLAFLYVGLDAPFLGVVQVVVYTGAIMMLFVFVLMLVGVDISDSFVETIRGQRPIGVVLALGLAAVLAGAVWRAGFSAVVGVSEVSDGNNPGAVANLLFSDYAFTLEVTGCLLIIAAMGAVVLTHRVRLTKKVTQADMVALRLREGMTLTPPPAPGNYARHNAADVPALDAAGRPIEDSVPSVLRMRGQVHTLRGLSQDLLMDEVAPQRRPDAVPPPTERPAVSSTPPADAAPGSPAAPPPTSPPDDAAPGSPATSPSDDAPPGSSAAPPPTSPPGAAGTDRGEAQP